MIDEILEDQWAAAEGQRKAQDLEDEFLAKWLPIWFAWGCTMPGYEQYLVVR